MSFNFQIDSQVKVYATSGAFPATGVIRTIYIDKSSDTAYYWDDATSTYKSLGGGSASIVWGSITGTLADQTDLQNALNAKVPYSGATSNVDLGEYQIKVGQLELDQTPTGTTGVAKIRWNDTDGTIDVGLKGGNVTLQVGLDELVRVVNKSGASLAESAYQAVRVRLVSEGGASGQRLAVVLAQANNDLNSATTIGIVAETIANNQEGFINRGGEVRGINTTGSLQGETWVDGDILYLSPTTPGALTNIKPTAPDHSITIGYVVYSHAVNGKIFVKVDNGYELEELHNVTDTDYSTPSDVDSLLIYQSSESLWKRLTWANVKAKLKTYFDTVYQAVLVSGTNIKTIEGQSILGAGNIDLTKADVGLSNVDNTSDVNKPVSTAQATAIGLKEDSANKATTMTGNTASNVVFLTAKAVYDWAVALFQPLLISGTNIKTINGNSLLGSGNLTISGGSSAAGLYALLPPLSGTIVNNRIFGSASAGTAYGNAVIYLMPFIPANTFTASDVSILVGTLQVGAQGRILIYSNGTSGLYVNKPYNKLFESADLSFASTGQKTAAISLTFTAGTIYWIGFQNSFTVTSASITSLGTSNAAYIIPVSASAAGNTSMFNSAYAYGSAPATMTTAASPTSGAYPYMAFTVA